MPCSVDCNIIWGNGKCAWHVLYPRHKNIPYKVFLDTNSYLLSCDFVYFLTDLCVYTEQCLRCCCRIIFSSCGVGYEML